MPTGFNANDVSSPYQPLFDLLATTDADEIVMTFQEIAKLIGTTLPTGAVLSSGWWTTMKYVHVRTWRSMGWHARSSLMNHRVRFVRDSSQG